VWTFQDSENLKTLQDRTLALHQAELALQAARSDKVQLEQKMVELNCHIQRMSHELQQKDAENERSRELMR
jgi:hypothetical protein